MSIIKGTNQIVAGFGGTKRSIGEVYFSQSSLASDNSGALPLFTGETIASANTIYPEFYNWVLAHTELQCTSAEYESTLSTYGECPKYVIDENGGTTTGTITVYGWLASGSTFYTKARNPVAGDSVWPSTDTTQESNYTVISLSNDTLTFSGPTKEWSGTYSTTTTGTGLVTTLGTSIRLPKLSNYIKAANPSEGIKNIEAGLPNITGDVLPNAEAGNTWPLKTGRYVGAFSDIGPSPSAAAVTSLEQNKPAGIRFDASRSSAVYGKSSTVTPASTTLYPWVVAYTAAIPASTAQAAEFQQALSGKADTNLGNVPSNYDYVVESYNDGTNWYRKYKSGWLEQGGQFRTPTTQRQTWGVITFLKPFSNTNYNVQAVVHSPYRTDTLLVYMGMASIGNKTTTKVDVGAYGISDADKNNGFDWRAEGQGA